MKTIKLKINSVPGYAGIISVQTDDNGVPLERFWRNRLKDAKADNCVEVVTTRTQTTKKEKAK